MRGAVSFAKKQSDLKARVSTCEGDQGVVDSNEGKAYDIKER